MRIRFVIFNTRRVALLGAGVSHKPLVSYLVRAGAHVGNAPDGSEGWSVATIGPDVEVRPGASVPAGAMISKSEEV